MATDTQEQIEHTSEAATQWIRRRGGWLRILRNTVVGYVQQAGNRMAAALAFYSLLLGGPALILTLVLGSALFGEDATKRAVAELLQGLLPPSAGGGPELAQEVLRTSKPAVSLAVLAGLGSFFGFTRACVRYSGLGVRPVLSKPLATATAGDEGGQERRSPDHNWLIRWSVQSRPLPVHGGKATPLWR